MAEETHAPEVVHTVLGLEVADTVDDDDKDGIRGEKEDNGDDDGHHVHHRAIVHRAERCRGRDHLHRRDRDHLHRRDRECSRASQWQLPWTGGQNQRNGQEEMGHVDDQTPTGRVDHAAPVQAAVHPDGPDLRVGHSDRKGNEKKAANHHEDRELQGDDGSGGQDEHAKQSIHPARVLARHGQDRRFVHTQKEAHGNDTDVALQPEPKPMCHGDDGETIVMCPDPAHSPDPPSPRA